MENRAIILKHQVIGVSVSTTADGTALHFVHLKRRGTSVRVLGHGTSTDAQSLRKELGARVPYALVWDSPNCIHRTAQGSGELETLVAKVFPGAPLNALHCSGWNEGNGTGVSLVRRDETDSIEDVLRKEGVRIVDLHVGPWGLLQLRSLLGPEQGMEALGGRTFTFDQGDLLAMHAAKEVVDRFTIGDDTLPGTHALAFATAWEHLVPAPQRLATCTATTAMDRREEQARVRYETGLAVLVVLLLGMLGTDMLVRARLDRTAARSTYSANERITELGSVERLRAHVGNLELLSAQLGIDQGERFASRTKRVLEHVPNDIRLDRITLDPLATLREKEVPLATEGLLRISGSCTNGESLHQWMIHLSGLVGVSEVHLEQYGFEERSGRSIFLIELKG